MPIRADEPLSYIEIKDITHPCPPFTEAESRIRIPVKFWHCSCSVVWLREDPDPLEREFFAAAWRDLVSGGDAMNEIVRPISPPAAPQRCEEFRSLRNARLLMGALRYGPLGGKGKPCYDRVADMMKRLQRYSRDRNREHLLDVANLCECEWVEGDGHYSPIDDGEHTHDR
jgi:hypothetical protein